VYLDRPWYSSGDGELLGVLLWPGLSQAAKTMTAMMVPSNQLPDLLKPYVTQWGMDPIWYSNPTSEIPVIENFKKNVANQTGLTLDEFPSDSPVRVNVAGHAVEYDKERKLWYCDIEIDLGTSYYPFVRLALARFQPKSVPNAHLSRVVLADFAQLAPDRTASIVFDKKNLKEIEVAVSGPGYKSSAAGRMGNQLEVTVETQSPGAGFALQCFSGNRHQGAVSEFKFHVLHFEKLLVLFYQGVFRLFQDLYHCIFIEFRQGGKHRKTTDEFRDKTELEQQTLAQGGLALVAVHLI